MAPRIGPVIGRRWRQGVALALLGAGLWAWGQAGYIALKAELAQVLLALSWVETRAGEPQRPWPGADMYPLAQVRFVRQAETVIVLDNASSRTLAFGPGHLARTPWIDRNQLGSLARTQTVIAGHRDTHFAVLDEIALGDRIEVEDATGRSVWTVVETAVIHRDEEAVMADHERSSLWLVTCYPFDSVLPGTPWRYVVRAVPWTSAGAAVARAG